MSIFKCNLEDFQCYLSNKLLSYVHFSTRYRRVNKAIPSILSYFHNHASFRKSFAIKKASTLI